MATQNTSSGLQLHEFVVCVFFVAILLTISTLSFIEKSKKVSHEKVSFEVTVVGAIKEEKKVICLEGATVADILSSISLTEKADLEKLIYEKLLQPDQYVIIPTKNALSVVVKGAVDKEGLLLLPEKTRINELPKFISLKESADRKFFLRKRRLLKEGETIIIPMHIS